MKRKRLIPIAVPLILLWWATSSMAVSLGGHNLSLLLPDSQKVQEDQALFVPITDYLSLDVNDVAKGLVSFHAGAYGRVQLNDYYEDDVARGELTYGYVNLRTPGDMLSLRAGRQFLYMGVAGEHTDSLKLDFKGLGGLKLSFFGGIPVASEHGGLSGDAILGGRVSYRFTQGRRTLAEIGFSGIHSTENGDPDRDNIGADFFLTAPGGSWLNIGGHVFYDLLYEDLYDVAVVPVLSLGDFTFTFRYNRTEPSAYLSKFSVLSVFSDDVEQDLGGTVDVELGGGWGIDATIESFVYETGENALEAEGNVRLYHGERFQNLAGIGLGWTDAGGGWIDSEEAGPTGDESASYLSLRGFGRHYLCHDSLFVDLEGFLFFYDRPVENKDVSASGSLHVGMELAKRLEILAGFAYEQNPLIDEEIRGTVCLAYSYFGSFGRKSAAP